MIHSVVLDIFDKYKQLTGAVFDNTTGLLQVTPSQFKALQDLNFDIGGNKFTLTVNAQLWPVRAPDQVLFRMAADV